MSAEEPRADLRAALDAFEVPGPRAEFRSDLMQRFTSGQMAALDEPTPELAAALDAWEVPAARSAFREELRSRFLAGEEQPQAQVHSLRRYFIAAAAAALFVLGWISPWGPGYVAGWRAVSLDQAVTPVVNIDGREVRADQAATFDKAFNGGCRVATDQQALRVYCDTAGVVVEIAPQTEIEVLREGGWMVLEIESGTLRLSTAEGFDEDLRVRTPDAEIQLKGRSLGVDVYDEGTCLCILEGQATLIPNDGSGERRVIDNSTAFVYRDREESVVMQGGVHHDEPLVELLDVSASLIGGE